MNFTSCLNNQKKLKDHFSSIYTAEERYTKIIQLGRNLVPYPKEDKISKYLVKGCQSLLYLKSSYIDKQMHFLIFSDALISAGLAALLLMIYEGESPETILKCPPTVLEELHITQTLSPNRSNGLRSLYLRMQKDSIRSLSLII